MAEILEAADDVASVLRAQLAQLQPAEEVVDPSEHGSRLRAISGIRIQITDVRAKFKFGGNVDRTHRDAVLAHLQERDGPGDIAAAANLRRRIDRDDLIADAR
jgi:transcriptional regulator